MPTASDIIRSKRRGKRGDSSEGTLRRALLGFLCLLIGCALPLLCWTLWLPEVLLQIACWFVFVGFVLGLWGWPRFIGKIVVLGSLAFATLAGLAVNHGLPTYPLKVHSTASWMKPLDSTWICECPGKPYSIRTASEVKRNGADSLRFDLRGGEEWIDQTFIHTFRSEVSTKDFPPTNSVQWYAFSVYFPPDFPIETNRLVFAQWHSHWQFMQPGRIPALAFRFIKGKLSVTLRHSTEQNIPVPDAVPSETLFENGKMPIGQWQDFVVQAKWSCQDDGFVNVWWNNEQIAEYKGAVGYNEATGPEFKFGLYRDVTAKTYIAYFNDVKSGDNASDVGFDPTKATKYHPEN